MPAPETARGVGIFSVAEHMICPKCGYEAWRDSADVGVGIIYGPWGCPCGWSETSEYDVSDGPKLDANGYQLDQWGGATPPQILESEIRR